MNALYVLPWPSFWTWMGGTLLGGFLGGMLSGVLIGLVSGIVTWWQGRRRARAEAAAPVPWVSASLFVPHILEEIRAGLLPGLRLDDDRVYIAATVSEEEIPGERIL